MHSRSNTMPEVLSAQQTDKASSYDLCNLQSVCHAAQHKVLETLYMLVAFPLFAVMLLTACNNGFCALLLHIN